MDKILIVEADFRLAERLCRSFSDTRTKVQSCGTLKAATALLEKEVYQMLIVDIELPDGNGFDIIHELKFGIYVPQRPLTILILPDDKRPELSELDKQGIADYITKPFSTAVLKAKVFTQFKRRKKEYNLIASERFEAIGSGSVISIGGEHKVMIDDYVFDFDTKEYCLSGKHVHLDRTEQCLLRTLIENKGIVLKKKALICKLRSETRTHIDEKILAQAVQTLKEKLEAQDYIKTIFAIGYIWINVEEKEK